MHNSLSTPESSSFKDMSLIKFSWRQKLTAVVLIALIGLIVVAGFAFMGLEKVNSSNTKQKDATEYEIRTLEFNYDLLSLELDSMEINLDNIDAFFSKITSLVDRAQVQEKTANILGDSEAIKYAEQVTALTKSYQLARQKWRENRNKLGFTQNEGAYALMFNAMKELQKVQFSMIDDDVRGVVSGQQSYFISKSIDDETKIESALQNLEAVVADMDWHDIVIGKSVARYREVYTQVKELVNIDKGILLEMQPMLNELKSTNLAIKQLEDKIVKQVIADAEQTKSSATRVIFIAVFIVGLIIFISLGSITRELNSQIKKVQKLMTRIADGDFSKQLKTNDNEKDEFTQLGTATNNMVTGMSTVISQVVGASKSLQQIGDQLEVSVKNLSDSSVEVEQSTQQSTVATQQISIAVNDVAKRSVNVSETAQSASQFTQEGGKIINDCVQSMEQIMDMMQSTNQEVSKLSASSTEMLGIIDVINGLADQTNLLALNAAIESARAGEAGRGFSVVADEVRALAQKTVGATDSISKIIKSFNDQSRQMGILIEKGINLSHSGQDNANNAKTSFTQIDESIQQVAEEMDQVVVAVEEISHNTNDIAKQVEDIGKQSDSVKTTRETLEEHTHELSSQADVLAQSTNRFILAKY